MKMITNGGKSRSRDRSFYNRKNETKHEPVVIQSAYSTLLDTDLSVGRDTYTSDAAAKRLPCKETDLVDDVNSSLNTSFSLWWDMLFWSCVELESDIGKGLGFNDVSSAI
jgi:hypothetical protein